MESPQVTSRKGGIMGRSMSIKFSDESPKISSGKQLVRRNSLVRNTMSSSKYAAALDAFKNLEQEEQDSWEDFRVRVKKQWNSSVYHWYYENFIIFIGLLTAIEYIHESYYLNKHNLRYGQKPYLEPIAISFTAVFGFNWILELLLADRTIPYLFSFDSVVDILIVLSNYYTHGTTMPRLDNVNTFEVGLLYAMHGFKTTRVLKGIKLRVKLNRITDAVTRFLAEIGLTASIMVLFFASVMQFFEQFTQNYPFHTWLYYIFVTIASVGYGDISPMTSGGRFAAIAMIGFAIFSVPKVTNELIEKMSLQSVHMRAVYAPKSRNSKHIVICGDLSSTSIQDFFGELFHEDHENVDLNAVILLPSPPTVELIFLMQSPKFFLSLTYLEGSALIDKDLQRSKAESAEAIFIMSNKFSANPDEEDSKSILLNLSIKRYLANYSRKMLYCMQLLRPENRRHLSNEANELAENDIVVCLNEIKMGVMAKAIMYPGANTLLMNLVSSFSDDSLLIEEIPTEGLTQSDVDAIFSSLAWVQEYEKGCGWEIYTTKLSTAFEGAKFAELSYALYDKIGVVLFALQVNDKVKGGSKLLLNPANFVIPSQDEFDIDAFVIAKNKASSDLSFGTGGSETNALQMVNRNFENFTNLLKSTVETTGLTNNANNNSDKKKLARGDSLKALSPVGSLESDKSGKLSPLAREGSKWKNLKKTAMLEKKIKSSNHQEVMHRLEDEHLNKFYYLRSSPVEISSVTIKTNVLDELPFINNHLIIIGKGLKNLYDLIRPLRAKHLGPLRYIVILYPYDIPPDVWLRISIFEGLLIVRGSPLEDTNLRRAGIFRAAQVVVLADGSTESSTHNGMDALIDSDAIFAYQHVKRMNPQTHVVLEIVNQSNIGYLEDENNQSLVNDPRFSPQFASGSLFTTDLLDSIVCQAYYNPDIIKVINKLISGVDQLDRGELVKQAAAEVGVKADHHDDSEDSRESPSPSGMARQRTPTKLLKVESSCLYQMSIPDNLEPKTYGALYHHLSLQGIIPLGLLRGIIPNINMGRKSNKLPYVYTNPAKDTELYTCDRVFVLSLKPEKLNNKLDVKEWLLDLQMAKNKDHKDKDKAGVDTKNPKGIENYEKHHKKLEDRFNKFQQETSKRLGKITEIIQKISELKQQQQQQISQLNSGFNTHRSYMDSPIASRRQSFANNEIHPDFNRSNSNDGKKSPSLNPPGTDSPQGNSRKNSVQGANVGGNSPMSILKRPGSAPSTAAPVAAAVTEDTAPHGNSKKRPSFSEPLVVQEMIIEPAPPVVDRNNAASPLDTHNINDQAISSAENSDNELDEKTNTTVCSTDQELDERTHFIVKSKASPRVDAKKGLMNSPIFGKKRLSEGKIIVSDSQQQQQQHSSARPLSAIGIRNEKISGPKITAITRPQTAERIRKHRAAADEQFHNMRAMRSGSPTGQGRLQSPVHYDLLPHSPMQNNLLSKSYESEH